MISYSLTQVVEVLVPSQEECGMYLNKKIINIDYWDTKIKVKENFTLLLMLWRKNGFKEEICLSYS